MLAYDGSPAARRALERCANSPLLRDLPFEIVTAGTDDGTRTGTARRRGGRARRAREVRTTLRSGRPEAVIPAVVAETPGALLVMGAYGHSPLRALIVGSTTTAMIRTVSVPVILVR